MKFRVVRYSPLLERDILVGGYQSLMWAKPTAKREGPDARILGPNGRIFDYMGRETKQAENAKQEA